MKSPTARVCFRTGLLFGAVMHSTCLPAAFAGIIDTTWIGGAGSWNDPTKWSGGVVPNNSGTTTFRAWINDGSVTTMTAAGSGTITIDDLTVGGAATLMIAGGGPAAGRLQVVGPMVTIDGYVQAGGNQSLHVGADGLFQGSGTLNLIGNARSESGTLTIGDTLRVSSFFGGYLGADNQPLVNRGHIYGNGGSGFNFQFVVAGTPIQNPGIIETQEVATFRGNFTRAGLGTLVATRADAAFQIGGTLLNAGQTLRVDANNPWELCGTIRGGTLEIAAGYAVRTYWEAFSATLDDVWVNGRMEFEGLGQLKIQNGVLKGNAEVWLAPGWLNGDSRLVSGAGSLVIDSGCTVRGGGGPRDAPFQTSGIGDTGFLLPVVNHGTIRADVAGPYFYSHSDFGIYAPSLTNDGALIVKFQSRIVVHGDATFLPGGVLSIEPGNGIDAGMLQVDGHLSLDAFGDILSVIWSATSPPDGFSRAVVRATGGISGTFASITPGWQADYRATEIWVRYVPEPGTAVCLGIAALAAMNRRGRAHPRRI